MVRPAASWENKRIALAFAHMVLPSSLPFIPRLTSFLSR